MIAVVMPDTGPLISLARIGRLDLLDRFRSQILITDAVQVELMDGPQDGPDQITLTEWIARGGNRIRIVETAYGALLRQNRELLRYVPEAERARFRRHSRVKDAGENSIRELADEVRDTLSRDATGLVLFEDASVMKMDFGPYVRVMTTWSFAVALERLEVIPSASELFDRIEDTGRTPPRRAFDRPSAAGAEDFEDSYDSS